MTEADWHPQNAVRREVPDRYAGLHAQPEQWLHHVPQLITQGGTRGNLEELFYEIPAGW